MNFPKFSIVNPKIIIVGLFCVENIFLETIFHVYIRQFIFSCIATKQSKKSSFESTSSSKPKIELHNETSAEDKFENVRERKL